MRQSTLEKYSGLYTMAKQPRSMKSHNLITWNKIVRYFNSTSTNAASFEELSNIAKGHLHFGTDEGNSFKFITYCINRGWLVKT